MYVKFVYIVGAEIKIFIKKTRKTFGWCPGSGWSKNKANWMILCEGTQQCNMIYLIIKAHGCDHANLWQIVEAVWHLVIDGEILMLHTHSKAPHKLHTETVTRSFDETWQSVHIVDYIIYKTYFVVLFFLWWINIYNPVSIKRRTKFCLTSIKE